MLVPPTWMTVQHLLTEANGLSDMGSCGQVDRALDSRTEGLGFDSHCWSCVEVLGTLLIPYCLNPPNNEYLVEQKNWKIVNGISCRKCAEFSSEEMKPYKREFQYQGCKLQKSAELTGISDYKNLHLHLLITALVCTYICLYWCVLISACTGVYLYLLVLVCTYICLYWCVLITACTGVYLYLLVLVCTCNCLYWCVLTSACTGVYL